MATAGPNIVGTGTGPGAPTPAWANPGNITADDASYATVTVLSQFSGNLQGTNPGFAIDSTATILGIQVTIKWKATPGANATDGSCLLMKAGATVGSDRATGARLIPSTEGTVTIGSISDLWGTTWTPADINNSGFGFQLEVREPNGVSTAVSVNYISITVTYSLPSPAGSRRAFAPQQIGPRSLSPQAPGIPVQNFSYVAPLPGAETPFHVTPQMRGPRAFRPQSQYDPRVQVAPVAYQAPLPGAEIVPSRWPTTGPQRAGPRAFRPQSQHPLTVTPTVSAWLGYSFTLETPIYADDLFTPIYATTIENPVYTATVATPVYTATLETPTYDGSSR